MCVANSSTRNFSHASRSSAFSVFQSMPFAQKYMPATLTAVSSTEQFLLPSPWHTAMKSLHVLISVLIFGLVVEPTRRAPVLADAVVVGRVPRLGEVQRVDVDHVGQLRLVELLEQTVLDHLRDVRAGGHDDVEPAGALRCLQLGDEVFVARVVADLHLDAEVLFGQRTDDVGIVVLAPGVHVQAARRLVGDSAVVAGGNAKPGTAVADIAGAGRCRATGRGAVVPAVVPPAVAPPMLRRWRLLVVAAARRGWPCRPPRRPSGTACAATACSRKLCGARILMGSSLDDMTAPWEGSLVDLDGYF